MRAIAVHRFGADPELVDLDDPEPGPDQIQVRIEAASRNPVDLAVAAGFLASIGSYTFPLVLGFDGAGTITAVGAEVTRFGVGDRVFGQFWDVPMQYGTLATLSVVRATPPRGALARVPEGVSAVAAAALPTAAMTALGAIDTTGATAGDTVIILGAAGGLGTFALQIAASRDLQVLASADPRTTDALQALGASEVLPRDSDGFRHRVGALPAGSVAAVLDFAGDTTLTGIAAAAVRPEGAVLSTAHGIPDTVRQSHQNTVDYRLERKDERLATVGQLTSRGELRPLISIEAPFSEALSALHATPAPGTPRGKTVIRMS